MIPIEIYAQTFPHGASFWLTKHNLQAADDTEFDCAVRPVVEACGGPGFVVIDAHTESYTGRRLYDIVKCERTG